MAFTDLLFIPIQLMGNYRDGIVLECNNFLNFTWKRISSRDGANARWSVC